MSTVPESVQVDRHQVPDGSLETDILVSTESLEQLQTKWNQLFEDRETSLYFQSYEWFSSWWKYYGEPAGYQLAFVTVRELRTKKLQLIWPLVVKWNGVCRIATWPCQELGHYGDVVTAKDIELERCLEAAWQQIHKLSIDILHFVLVREDAIVHPFLTRKGRCEALAETSHMTDLHQVADWETYRQSLGRKFRKEQNRLLRRFSELGDVSFDVVDKAEEIVQVVPELLRLKRQWLTDSGIYGRVLEQSEAEPWLIDTALKANEKGKLNLTTMKLNGQLVAGQVAFLSGGELHAYIGVFDVQYKRYGIGRLQTEDAIHWAHENGIAVFDFMPPCDSYKTRWTNASKNIETFLYAVSLKGRLTKCLFSERVRQRIKSFYARVPRQLKERLIVRRK